MKTLVYLDYAAATPLDERVFDAMCPFLTEQFYNPSAAYSAARNVRVAIEEARHELAIAIGAKRDEVVMTAGATESINLAFSGLLEKDDHVVIGATEHQAVRSVASGFAHSVVPCDAKGIIHPDSIKKVVTDKTKLISITAADSEVGSIQPLSKIAEVVETIRRDRRMRNVQQPLYFHTDASQVAGVIDLHVARLGVDMLTLNAAKCYGPKQVGLLWISSHIHLKPLIVGGGQERGLRSGTENVAGIVGFALALRLAQKHRRGVTDELQKLRDLLQDGLEAGIPELIVNGSKKKRLPGYLNVSLDNLDAERVVFNLDSKGIMVATGAACAANKGTRSEVLSAIGLSDSLADGSLRFSIGKQTTREQIDAAIPLIIEAIRHEATL